jgi:hypothetical protein
MFSAMYARLSQFFKMMLMLVQGLNKADRTLLACTAVQNGSLRVLQTMVHRHPAIQRKGMSTSRMLLVSVLSETRAHVSFYFTQQGFGL